jgi:hypothetical protein
VPISVLNTGTNHLAVFFAEARTVRGTGPDGPRPERCSKSSSAYFRMVRAWALMAYDGAECRLLRSIPRSHLPGGTSSRRRDPKVCLGIDRPPNTSLVDVELKRFEV